MANRMQGYLQEQPPVLAGILNGFQEVKGPFVEWCGGDRPSRVVVVGSGSSCYVAKMAKPFLQELLRVEIATVVPSRIGGIFAPQPGDRYLILSQEGKSVNTYGALTQLKQAGADVAAITSMPDSPIARECDCHLLMDCGAENSGPKTVGVTASYVMLCLAGLEMALAWGCIDADGYREMAAELGRSVAALSGNIAASMDWYRQKKEILVKAPFFAVICDSRLLGAGLEGVLKLVETVYIPSCAYEMEEFIHGPHCLLGTTAQIFLLVQGDGDFARMKDLCLFAREKGMTVHPVADVPVEDGLTLKAAGRFGGPHFLLPFQVVSAYLSEEMGHDLNRPKYEGFGQRFGSKLY